MKFGNNKRKVKQQTKQLPKVVVREEKVQGTRNKKEIL